MSTFIARALFVALAAITLSGCVDSENPILADAEPVFGKHLTLQFYSLRDGAAHEPQRAVYNWNGGLYARVSGGMHDVPTFTVHPFEDGDYLIQETAAQPPRLTEYALLHPVADGVYQILPIDADDADDQTRAAYCHTVGKSSCRIEARAQLFAFARATAALRKKDGGLVIRLDDNRRARRH